MERLSRSACLGFALGAAAAAVVWYVAWVRWTTGWTES